MRVSGSSSVIVATRVGDLVADLLVTRPRVGSITLRSLLSSSDQGAASGDCDRDRDQARARRRARKHFIFTDEHLDLRESMSAWVKKELHPHRNEWEETLLAGRGHAPRRRARLPRPLLPGGVRRAGRRLLLLAGPRRVHELLGLRRHQHGLRGADRHGPAPGPPARHRGAEAALPGPRDQGRADRLPRDHRAGRRLRRRRDPHDRDPRRRRVRDQRLEDVHHQRRRAPTSASW